MEITLASTKLLRCPKKILTEISVQIPIKTRFLLYFMHRQVVYKFTYRKSFFIHYVKTVPFYFKGRKRSQSARKFLVNDGSSFYICNSGICKKYLGLYAQVTLTQEFLRFYTISGRYKAFQFIRALTGGRLPLLLLVNLPPQWQDILQVSSEG